MTRILQSTNRPAILTGNAFRILKRACSNPQVVPFLNRFAAKTEQHSDPALSLDHSGQVDNNFIL
jgi:hypothetical protein